MPAPPPIAYATLSAPLPDAPYVLGITPSPTTPHLVLRHPSKSLTVADNQTLQSVASLQGAHGGHISSVSCDGGELWSAAVDGSIIRWDERSRQKATVIKAFIRKPLPVTALTTSAHDSLVIGGTELVSSEAHILFWDPRNSSAPLYTHSSTHSDDITHLSLLRSSSTFLPASHNPEIKTPSTLLLSASTDGLIALSDMKEGDEEEALVAEENWGQSIADAGGYMHKGKMGVWARSDMDEMCLWGVGRGNMGEIELQDHKQYPSSEFKFKTFTPPKTGPSITQTALDEFKSKTTYKSDYLINVVPTLGISSDGAPMTIVGTNEGDMILQHHSASTSSYQPSAFFLSGPGTNRGHKDVVRAMYHDLANEALYTGSEDGVLAGFSLASLPERLTVGDPDVDDDGGDGREEDEYMDEESEIETESSQESDDDEDEDMEEEGPRYGPIIGAGSKGRPGADKKEDRRKKRYEPY
ncbi:hypothetical protein I314_02812 [Cryptococcus bacillisporus CA1873]|uniref:WD40 repeat-like protein n=1 Tax=Cryptococcus bacillisporus CA1873 TaxID=1296111 RepID=A0ABR5BCI6_CRYGA|nr:hypothetical protein I314_02812 [Cryptococcus bacillisporus CA1873]|eukprot:KIR64029.1 hypothetical protein I314_02812 [Cryptococcus gattii CA1873]